MEFPWSKSKPAAPGDKCVLVIDDDKEMRKTIELWLKASGFACLEARGGRSGWDLIQKNLPDLVILDVRMPQLNGYEICKLVRSNETTRHIPILLLTGLDTMGEVEQGFDAGATDYIAKPFDWDRLEKKVRTLLKLPDPPKA